MATSIAYVAMTGCILLLDGWLGVDSRAMGPSGSTFGHVLSRSTEPDQPVTHGWLACQNADVAGQTEHKLASTYPDLFQPHPHSWGGVKRDYTLQLTLDLPDEDLVVNVRLIAVDNGRVVVCKTIQGWRTLPRGSREQGEPIGQTASRELLEEAGYVFAGPVTWVASFTVTNNTTPWRDWHPFPVSAWLVGTAAARRIGAPTNPPDGETVVEVMALEPGDAIDYLSGFDNGGQAQLVAMARDLGRIELPLP